MKNSIGKYMNRFTVLRYPPSPINLGFPRYDGFIGTIGYETRARWLMLQMRDRIDHVVGYAFPELAAHSYEVNARAFAREGHVASSDLAPGEVLAFLLERLSRRDAELVKICVDISSMTRARIAGFIQALGELRLGNREIVVDWFYVPARFSRKLAYDGPVVANDPIPGFEGWADPVLPLRALVGVGPEGSIVLGLLDDLEPIDTYAMIPSGFDLQYDRVVAKANAALFQSLATNRRSMYDVLDPFEVYLAVDSRVQHLAAGGRVVIVR